MLNRFPSGSPRYIFAGKALADDSHARSQVSRFKIATLQEADSQCVKIARGDGAANDDLLGRELVTLPALKV